MKKVLSFCLLLSAFSSCLFAALSINTTFEVNQAGDNTNGACFVTGATGMDNTYPTPTVTTYTDLVIDAVTNTNVTSAAFPFDANSPGRCLRITGGVGFTLALRQIVSVAGNVATLDASAGTLGSTGGQGKSGGALATLAQLNTNMCAGCTAWVKADATYTITSGINFGLGTAGMPQISGYTTTRGDNGKATVQATATITAMITLSTVAPLTFRNFILDANLQASTACLDISRTLDLAENIECSGPNRTTGAIRLAAVDVQCHYCYVHDGISSGDGFTFTSGGATCFYCTVANLTGSAHKGFNMTAGLCSYCTAYGLTVAGSDAFVLGVTSSLSTIDHCVVYNVTRDAVRVTSAVIPMSISNCVFDTVTTGIDNVSGTTLNEGQIYNDYNFTFSGTPVSGLTAGTHSMTLSADPFTSPGTGNFTLNNTPGGGAVVRTAGAPSSLPGVTGTSFPDGGVMQTQSTVTSTGGSVVLP